MATRTTAEDHEVDEESSGAERVKHLSTAARVARGKSARAELPRSAHAAWEPPPTGRARSSCSRSRRRRACPSWCRSATGGCSRRRSPSTAARRIMAADLAASRDRACTRSSAATPTSPTSASSQRPTAGSCSTSTTSTRRCRGRSSGTSSGSRRASRSPAATAASTSGSARRPSRSARTYREAMAAVRGDGQSRRLVRAPRRRRAASPSSSSRRPRRRSSGPSAKSGEGAQRRTACGRWRS